MMRPFQFYHRARKHTLDQVNFLVIMAELEQSVSPLQ